MMQPLQTENFFKVQNGFWEFVSILLQVHFYGKN